jgi:NitT/TauT family transport system substrate-binding protein
VTTSPDGLKSRTLAKGVWKLCDENRQRVFLMRSQHQHKSSAFFFLAFVLTACFPLVASSAEKSLTRITIGISPFQDTLLPTIGKEKGWFESEGLDVVFKTLAWNAMMPAVASNAVDIATYNTTGIVAVYNKQPEITFWYPWNIFTQGAALMGRPNIGLKTMKNFEKEGMAHRDAVKSTVQQLKAKTIVTTMGSDMGKAVVMATGDNGLSRSDYKIIDMDPDQGLAAFISGTGDAYLGGIPQRTRLTKEGYLTLLSGPDIAPVPLNGWVTTKAFAEKNKESLLKLQHVMFRIIRYTNANQDVVAKAITDRLNQETGAKMTIAEFKRFWNEIENYPNNAAEVQKDILNQDGFAYWKRTWDNDNQYFVEIEKLIPIKVPYDAFWGDKVQKEYVEKYGDNETGF